MADPRPIGMRVTRPYATEEEFIRGDGLAIVRRAMIIIGAPERPPGIIIRFELLLLNGTPVFRGEGKVVAFRFHPNGRNGLEVCFTNLDAHARALVERVMELRKHGELTPVPSVADLTPAPKIPPAPNPPAQSIPASDPSDEAEPAHVETPTPLPLPSEVQSQDSVVEPTHDDLQNAEDLEGVADDAHFRVSLSIPPPEELERTPVDSVLVAEKPQLTNDPAAELTVFPEESTEDECDAPAFSPPAPRADDASKERLRKMALLLDPPGPEDESDQTPFAPSVIFAPPTNWADSPARAPKAPPRPAPKSAPAQPSSPTPLDLLRTRSSVNERPASRDNLLEKLRNRKKTT